MKTVSLSITKTLVILFIGAIGFSACKKGAQTPPLKRCENVASFLVTNNADGYYGRYLIQLEDGSLLYPCSVEDNSINTDVPYNGMGITLEYEILGDEEGCQGLASTLNSGEPIVNELRNGCVITRQTLQYKRARITCISPAKDERREDFCGVE